MSNTQENQQEAPATPVLTAKQAKRANASSIGMFIATAVTLALVLFVVLLNPTHTAETYTRDIDVATVASQAEDAAGYEPAAAVLPDGWTSNYARWTGSASDGVAFWEVGYLTPDREFIQVTQTNNSNPTWFSQRLEDAQPSGQRVIDGVTWELLDSTSGDVFLTTEQDGFTLILNGTADLAQFDVLGSAVLEDLS
ncbi:hypothetical protein ASH00_12000 [Arthrobacter sp. Soil782]|uniref:DUF4245 domain-containing protein n=1 Tax=Arthrobacter sp. Soil782 TaxID=1736410 RepID=UPI0006FB665F|nr:DUF4245 domain-containing protein [Arthrobacter sp. Soil782]KRF05139.1 hypothetical protein ASH00_12000 [Arthrobacter sp. Soil782]